MRLMPATTTYRVGHLFCGIGAGAKGFNDARPRVHGFGARFECAGGIDNDPGAIRNFNRIAGHGTVLDLFDRQQYIRFHGKEPPPEWREATPADIRAAHGNRPLDVMFLSAPCKGFSGLLSTKASGTDKYQALNELTVRGVWLTLEAFKDKPIRIIIFENVPRIFNRGKHFLEKIYALFREYGYVFAPSTHDCGEVGGLAQHRKRALIVARHAASVPNFLYQPHKSKVRGVGEVIGLLPLPGDPTAGEMHRVPRLQWKTWVRLAFVPPGKDWRALNDLAVVDGQLRDFGIMPEVELRDNALGVLGWDETAPTLTSQRAPGQGRFSVADIRVDGMHNDGLGVRSWDDAARVVAGRSRPGNGAHSVADPRAPEQANQTYEQYGVRQWDEATGTITGNRSGPGGGSNSVADPRHHGKPKHNNCFRIVPFDGPSPAVTGPGGTGISVADPRPTGSFGGGGKYRITEYDEPAGAVIAGSTTGQSAYAVADPNPGYKDAHHNVLRVTPFDQPSGTVTSGHGPTTGAISVADPRPVCLNGDHREGYATQGHYGVVDWDEASNAIPGYAKHDRGKWAVADPRDPQLEPWPELPAANDRLVARIIARDGTWHRPFTTLELAALQSIFDPGEVFDLEGGSDQVKREWIGNAVPSAAARGMAETIGEALLLADMGETFTLSSREIWTKPLALALSVDPRQEVFGELI